MFVRSRACAKHARDIIEIQIVALKHCAICAS